MAQHQREESRKIVICMYALLLLFVSLKHDSYMAVSHFFTVLCVFVEYGKVFFVCTYRTLEKQKTYINFWVCCWANHTNMNFFLHVLWWRALIIILVQVQQTSVHVIKSFLLLDCYCEMLKYDELIKAQQSSNHQSVIIALCNKQAYGPNKYAWNQAI